MSDLVGDWATFLIGERLYERLGGRLVWAITMENFGSSES